MTPETYVVRIYRRVRGGPGAVVGVIELPGTHRQAAFQDAAQLAEILSRPRRYLRASKRGQL